MMRNENESEERQRGGMRDGRVRERGERRREEREGPSSNLSVMTAGE